MQGRQNLRRSAAIRVSVAVGVSAALTAIAIALLWQPLDLKTDIVGYPIFADFNVYNYFTAYLLMVVAFPIVSLLLFLGLTRIGPRIGLAVPPSRGSLRPGEPAPRDQNALDADPPVGTVPTTERWAVQAGRIGLVGAVLGIEAGIAADRIAAGLVLGIVAYALAVTLAAAALRKWARNDWPPDVCLAAVNAVGASLSVAGLVAVSSSTEVRILSNGATDSYPWFPVWLALPAAAAILVAVAIALRRADSPARVTRLERRALVLIVAPIGLFLLLASLPGGLGTVDMFHTGENVAATRLVGDGYLPWRDIVLSHGILNDVAGTAVGFAVFGNSIWGFFAGSYLLLVPLYSVSVYFLLAYLFGRNWLFLLFAALLILGTSLAPDHFRLILWPPILLLLASVLNRPTAPRAASLALLTLVQIVLTPEAAPALPAIAAVLVLYEWYECQPGAGIVHNFRRTLLFVFTAIAGASLFAGYLASVGALDDFVYISRTLVRGHPLTGGTPPTYFNGISAHYLFIALAPPAAVLISIAYAFTRLRLRRWFHTEDWVMAAVALFTAMYYAKFLARMGEQHAVHPYAPALPLVLYIVYRSATAIEQRGRGWKPATPIFRATAHPVSLVLVLLVVALSWGTLSDRITTASSNYRPEVASRPQFKRVGYAPDPFDPVMYRDLKRVVDAYLGPQDRIFDFTNSPALFFYLFDRDPSTRYFHVSSLALRADTQSDLIDRLRASPPRLIAFDTFLIGLPNIDGIPTEVRLYNVSRWILDHYRPLLATHTTTFYVRRDLPPPNGLRLAERPLTKGIDFLTQQCNWGYSPNFLSSAALPGAGARGVPARLVRGAHPQATIVGWAGDARMKAPAREVIAAADGRIVARTKPNIDREDLLLGGSPLGFARSGFRLQIPAALQKSGDLQVLAVARDGRLAELTRSGAHPAGGKIRLGGREIRLDPRALAGHIDSTLPNPPMQIVLPPHSRWTDYRWLEIDAGNGGFRRGSFAIFDRQGGATLGSRQISFQTLNSPPDHYIVPVASCPQWHGYRARRLFLQTPHGQRLSGVRLIR
jgi:hypothetical protein